MPRTPLSVALQHVAATSSETCIDEFAIQIDFVAPQVVISVRGELDAHTAPTLGAVLGGLEDQGHHVMILDLAALSFIGAGGLGVIAGAATQLRRVGGDLTLRAPRVQARRILDITGVSQRILIEDREAPVGLHADLTRVAWRPTRHDILDAQLVNIVALAAVAIDGADGVSVSLARHGRLTTVAASNDTVLRMDDHQYDTGEGPCISAARDGLPFDIDALEDETRWPAFVPRAMSEGIASILSTPLLTENAPIGALNIYSGTAGAFGSHQRELAAVFSTHASQAAGGSRVDLTDDAMDARIAEALQSRTILALAQGVLMARHHVSPDEASAVLQRSARRFGTTTLAQATDVLDSTADVRDARAIAAVDHD